MPNVRKQMAVRLVADGENPFRITLENPTNMTIKLGQVIPAGLLMLVGHGGSMPYAFTPTSIGDSSGSSGLAVDIAGNITGTATDLGTFQFIGEGQDEDGLIFRSTFSVTVYPHTVWIDDSPPTVAVNGFEFSYQFIADGPGSITYAINWPTGAPAWATFDTTTGVLSGTPTGTAIADGYTVTATDSTTGEVISVDSFVRVVDPVLLNTLSGVVMPISSRFQGAVVDVGLTKGVPPYVFSLDRSTLPLDFDATIKADASNTRFGLIDIFSSPTPFSGTITVIVKDALGFTSSADVDIRTYIPNEQITTQQDGTDVGTPGAKTYNFIGATVTNDGDTATVEYPAGSGNQVIDASDHFGHTISNPNALTIYSDDASVDVLGHSDSDGGFSWRLRAATGGGGGPYLTGGPLIDSSGGLAGGDPFDFTPTLNNAGAGNTAQRWELDADSINAAWCAIDQSTGELTGTLPIAGGYAQLNVACTMLDGAFKNATCTSRIGLSILGGNWWDGIVNASSHAIVFDCNDLTTLYTDVLHTTPANVGDTVKAIANKGTAGGYATSSTGQVLALDSGRNLYYLEGPTNGTSGAQPFIFTWSGSEFMGSGSISIICAAEFFATTDYQYTCQFGLDSDNGGSHGHLVLGNNQSDGGYELFNGGGGGASVPIAGFASGAHVFGGIADAGTASYTHYIDGTAIHGQSGINYHVLSTKQLSVFDYFGSNAAAPCKKNYSYVAVDRAISGTEMAFAGANAL